MRVKETSYIVGGGINQNICLMNKDELILKISDALNESRFWFKLEDKVGEIDFSFLENFAHDLEEFIAENITDNIL